MKMKFGALVPALFILSACTSYKTVISDAVSVLQDLSSYSTVVLIPQAGCPGCISQAEAFFRQNCEDTAMLFIFTNITSQKILKGKMKGVELDNMENVIIDKDNRYYFGDFHESLYPYVLQIKYGGKNEMRIIE